MKRITTLIALFLFAAMTVAAQDEKKEEQFNTTKEFKNKVFEVHNRSPRELHASIALLGSGFKGAAINVNNEMRTITVRDFPENIAAIEDALKRLDKAAAASADIEMKISVLIASKSPLGSNSIPEELAPVVKQLQSTLRYAHYGVMTATVHRTTPGRVLEGSGVADAALLGMVANQERPIMYKYHLYDISSTVTTERSSIDVGNFDFSMQVPISMGTGQVQYQSVGFRTPVSIREKEKVVIGTTTMGEKALIVVVTATIQDAAVPRP
jgi:hypothetical protein